MSTEASSLFRVLPPAYTVAGTFPSRHGRPPWDPADPTGALRLRRKGGGALEKGGVLGRVWREEAGREDHDGKDGADVTERWASFLDVPAGTYEFKVVRTGSWTENYGRFGMRDGENLGIQLPRAAGRVRVCFDVKTHDILLFVDEWWVNHSVSPIALMGVKQGVEGGNWVAEESAPHDEVDSATSYGPLCLFGTSEEEEQELPALATLTLLPCENSTSSSNDCGFSSSSNSSSSNNSSSFNSGGSSGEGGDEHGQERSQTNFGTGSSSSSTTTLITTTTSHAPWAGGIRQWRKGVRAGNGTMRTRAAPSLLQYHRE